MKELKEFSSEEEYVPRSIQYIVVHCSATRANIPFTEEQLLKCHLQRGFKYIGYHFYITRDGELHSYQIQAQSVVLPASLLHP
mgnify:CR=1 FL=1